MTQHPVRVGLVGYGFGGRTFHAPFIAAATDCELIGVVTRDPERRAAAQAEHPSTQCVDSLEDLVRIGVEAVAISTPADTHIELVHQAIDLGLAVVCDKPFALDPQSAQSAYEHAEGKRIVISVFQNRRWDSDLLTVQRLIKEDTLGTITRFESRFERFAPQRGPRRAGGGTLLDLGTHLIDQALLLFGPASSVYGELRTRLDQEGRDDDVFLALTHESGFTSHLICSWTAGDSRRRFVVSGTNGAYVVDGLDGQEAALKEGRRPADEGDTWGIERASAWGEIRRGDAPAEKVPSERGRWDTFYPAFAAAVRGNGAVPVDARDSIRGLQVIAAVRQSAATGRVVQILADE